VSPETDPHSQLSSEKRNKNNTIEKRYFSTNGAGITVHKHVS
jgi:hypothetical protein